ncbi:hypothetical protein [Citrobacter freundii]|uniref:Uncharacterized protein n=1 Tax=Citrobacter freundii TaxID=546 RepID=A0A7G2ITP3_CITFR|nr:hypothetical protein [Citrobacter freundii]
MKVGSSTSAAQIQADDVKRDEPGKQRTQGRTSGGKIG